MSQRRGDPVAPSATGAEWKIRFSTNEAAKGWQELENQAAGNLRKAWETMRNDPGPGPGKPTPRHHPLKGSRTPARRVDLHVKLLQTRTR